LRIDLMKHPIRRRFMYLAFQGLRALVERLPLEAARRLGWALGVGGYAFLRTQRRLALEHLAHAFGDTLSASQRRAVARRAFSHLGQNAMEWLQLATLSADEVKRLVSGDGVEHLRGALAAGNGAILLTAHFGNWELITLYLRALGFEGGVLARRLRYPEYESFLIELRGGRGVPTFSRGSLKDVAKVLRANQIIGMLPDQDVDSLEGIFVNFFGHPAYTPVGPAALSLMTGAPIVPCFVIREGRRFRLVIEPPLRAPQGVDRPQAIAALTQAWSDVVESHIRRHPDHWVWMHRRWKTQPALSNKHQAVSQSQQHHASGTNLPQGRPVLGFCLLLTAYSLLLAVTGCGKSTPTKADVAPEPPAAQQMSGFTLTGYEDDGTKRWELEGQGARVDGQIVTILQPRAVGRDPGRTAYLTASAAQINQGDRHVRMEHDVTIHTSDGLWLTSPVLHWIPDRDEMATDQPVRLETDHMVVRGYGASGQTQLKRAVILRDIEMVLNPSDHDLPGGAQQVTITCDGPLSFDYEHHIATFEDNVHVKDPKSGDLYSDKLIAYLDERTHTIRYAEAIGRVRIHQQQNTALSERAVYEPAIGKITLVGRPSLLVYPAEKSGGTQLSFGGLNPEAASSESRQSTRPATR
jgi:KDO2-lipid IV(A) lauroyltransferase